MENQDSTIKQSSVFGNTRKAFKVETLKSKIAEGVSKDQNFTEAKKYFLTYFAKSLEENYYEFEPQEDEEDGRIANRKDMDSIYKKFPKFYDYINKDGKTQRFNLREWFEVEHNDTFKVSSDPRTSRFFTSQVTDQQYINLSKGFLHKNRKPFASYDKRVQENVNKILNHIKVVWNSNNMTNYEFCLNFLAHALTGHKMQVALFLKSGEGTGKSIIIDFIIKHVIGEALGLSTPRAQQLMKFNAQLLGKVFVCLEELPTGSKSEWHSVSDYLKDLVTGSKLDIEKKYADCVQTLNLISLILLTNNENTIKFGKDIRRYMMCDVSHDKVGDSKYFDDMIKVCCRETGEAFFMWLLERYDATKDFNPTECPITDAKMEMKERNLTPLLKYIKREFVSTKQGLCDPEQKHKMMKLNTIKNEINIEHSQHMTTQAFHLALKTDMPIVRIVTYGKNKELFIEPISFNALLAWFIKKGFWNETFDEFSNTKVYENEENQEKSRTNIDEIVEDDELVIKDKQIEELKAQLKKLQDDQQALIAKAVAEALAVAHKANVVTKKAEKMTTADELDELVDCIFTKSAKPSKKK
jgi:hypothetical protein